MISDKEKRLFKRYFFQIGIKDTSEIDPESKRGNNKKKKPVKHYFLLNLTAKVGIKNVDHIGINTYSVSGFPDN